MSVISTSRAAGLLWILLLGASSAIADIGSAGAVETTASPEPMQPDIDQSDQILLGNYQQAVAELMETGSAYDPRLAEAYLGLGRALHRLGDIDNAFRAYEQSMYIARINDGLYSISQAPMLRGMAICLEEGEQWQEATDHYRHLLWVHQQNLGSDNPSLIPLLAELSGWYLKAYNNHPGRPASYLAESEQLARLGLSLTLPDKPYDTPEAGSLLRHLAAGQYLQAEHLRRNPPRESGMEFTTQGQTSSRLRTIDQLDMQIGSSYRTGRDAYLQLVDMLRADPLASAEDVAAAMAELGDWHLRFGYQSAADDTYRAAYRYLEEHHSADVANEIFAVPKLIQPLWPTNRQIEIVADVTVNARGRVTSLEIQDIEDENLRNRMHRHLRVARFRPSLQNGEPGTAPYRLAQRIAVR